MATYHIYWNRIFYRASGFKSGLRVTAYFWSPKLEKTELKEFTELEYGIYYLDYHFGCLGEHLGVVFENDVIKSSKSFRVHPIGSVFYNQKLT